LVKELFTVSLISLLESIKGSLALWYAHLFIYFILCNVVSVFAID
jgi:hypothetical protein